MSDDRPDQESKTEQATEKRLNDAIEKGNVAVSREATTLAFLLGLLVVTIFLVRDLGARLAGSLAILIEQPGEWRLGNAADVLTLSRALFLEAMFAVAPTILVLVVLGLASSMFQMPPHLSFEKLKPDPSRISISQGWRRLFSATSALEFLKSVIKLVLIGSIGATALLNDWFGIAGSMNDLPHYLPSHLVTAAITILLFLTLSFLVFSVADVAVVRFLWRRGLRMTREEVKQEHKQAEGDPVFRARRLAIARNRSRKRMLADVKRATLVVANPTHYAVAMRYVREEGGAPKVVAKGQDYVALNIRRIAEENGIPVVEDKALARSLYQAVKVDQTIPQEFYRAVADILILLQKRGKHGLGQSRGH